VRTKVPAQTGGDAEMADQSESTEVPRIMHGYFREHLFMGAREKADIRARMTTTAEHHGYLLGKVFEEKVETAPAALRALLDAAITDRAAVVLAGLEHLAIHGDPIQLRAHLSAAIAREVFVAASY
jgi:hypothetical protein